MIYYFKIKQKYSIIYLKNIFFTYKNINNINNIFFEKLN